MENILLPEPHKILNITKMTDLEWLSRVEYKEVSKIYKKFLDLFLICHIIKMLNY